MKTLTEKMRNGLSSRRWLAVSLAALLAAAATAGVAQTAPPSTVVDKTGPDTAVRHFSSKELAGILQKALTPAASYSQVVLSKHGDYLIDDTIRSKSGQAEIHEHWDDNIFMQEGNAIFITGGVAVDAKVTAPGERRGTAIKGGTTRVMRPGDYIFIPAGTPHQMMIDPGQQVKFIHFKMHRP